MKGHEQGSSPPKMIITPEIVMVQCYYVAAPVTPLVPPMIYLQMLNYISLPLHDYPALSTS